MKKVLTGIGAILACAALFLLLPQLSAAPPEMGTQPLGLAYFVFPAAALFYGSLIPFLCFDDKYLAVIEGAIFIVFAWAAGWSIPAVSPGGTIACALLMLGGALSMTLLRRLMPIRFKPTHWRRKALWAVLESAGIVSVFLIRAFLRPTFLTSMERDCFDFDFILFYFPLLALVCGGLLPLFSAGDVGFMAVSLGGFVLLSFVGFCLTDIAIPLYSFILGANALAAACIVSWLRERLLSSA